MDPVHFSGREILEMAIRIEENGLQYYTEASKAAKSEELKELFETLAGEEEQHIVVFNDLKDLTGDEWQEGYDPYVQEGAQYLKAIADTEVFTTPDRGAELARKVIDERDALRLAIDMEKDSLLFYYELQRMIRDKDKEVLEKLIEQEKDHVRKLTELERKIAGSGK